MKKNIVFLIVILSFCLIFGAAAAQSEYSFPQGNPPMNGPMNRQQMPNQMGNPPMNGQQMPGGMENRPAPGEDGAAIMSVQIESGETVNLLSTANANADVITTLRNGTPVRVLETSGNYTKIDIMGQTGYIPTESLTEFVPQEGMKPPAMTENGQQPPAKPEDGQEPPAKPEDGQEPPAMSENGQQPPAMPENGQQPPAKPEDGQEPPAKPEDGQTTNNDTQEPGLQNLFAAILRLFRGEI